MPRRVCLETGLLCVCGWGCAWPRALADPEDERRSRADQEEDRAEEVGGAEPKHALPRRRVRVVSPLDESGEDEEEGADGAGDALHPHGDQLLALGRVGRDESGGAADVEAQRAYSGQRAEKCEPWLRASGLV